MSVAGQAGSFQGTWGVQPVACQGDPGRPAGSLPPTLDSWPSRGWLVHSVPLVVVRPWRGSIQARDRGRWNLRVPTTARPRRRRLALDRSR